MSNQPHDRMFMRKAPWIALALLTAGLFGWWAWTQMRASKPRSLVLAIAPEDRWGGFTELQKRGLLTLVKDCLETDGHYAIGLAEVMEAGSSSAPILEVAAHRDGMTLALNPKWLRKDAESRSISAGSGIPSEVLMALCLDLQIQPASFSNLVPRDPIQFWDLIETTGWGGDKDLEHCLALSRELVKRDPQLASAWCALGHQSFRVLSLDQSLDLQAQAEAEEKFHRALALIPGYPRATYQFANLKTDSAGQREALDALFSALKKRPHAAFLYGGLAYAARTSGLLDGAQKALRRREALLGPIRFESGMVENTYLYSGDLDRFDRALGEDDVLPWRSIRDFYRGYIRLLKGRKAEAMRFFRRAHEVGGASLQFERLAMVYDLQLEGRTSEARAELDGLKRDRVRLREPDGEFTFKLAEAFAYLGDPEAAQEMAARAFAQGFGCTRWYRESPLLKPLQESPQFKALLRHLEERQQLLEERFPARRFE